MKLLTNVVATTALLLSSAVFAQEETRETLIIEGAEVVDVHDVYQHFPNAKTYKLYLEFDTAATLLSSSSTSKVYDNALTRLDVEFFDADGQLIAGPPLAFDGDLPENIAARPDVSFYADGQSERLIIRDINFGGRSYWPSYTGSAVTGLAGSIFADFSGFPTFIEGSTTATVPYIHFGYTDLNGNSLHFDLEGAIASLSYLVMDADNDGYADDIDLCPASATEETVWFDGWYDSGVTNVVDADGCTVMDHYAACSVEEEQQQTFFSRRSLFSGPSYCEKQVAYGLVSDGTIDYRTARDLRDALYYSAQNGGRR